MRLRISIILLLCICEKTPGQPSFNVLVFSKTAGFRHSSIPNGITMIGQLGNVHNFITTATEETSYFTDSTLSQYRVVVFLNTTGDILNENEQAAFERFIQNNGGFVGIHSASDTEYGWPWYGQLVGAYFSSHPAIQQATANITDHSHPSTDSLPAEWNRTDEWYNFQSNPRPNVHVLATLDESTYIGGTMGDHPISWYHYYSGGRAWYTGMGHTETTYEEPLFRAHILGAIEWAAGRYNVVSIKGGTQAPIHFALMQNYPNPFNPSTRIRFQLPHTELVTLRVFDVLGREVRSLVSERLGAGEYEVPLEAHELSSGVYYYRMDAGNFRSTRKLLLVR